MSAVRRRYRICGGLSVEFSYRHSAQFVRRVDAEWDPTPPDKLRGAALRRYQRARAHFSRLVARDTGDSILLVDSFGVSREDLEDLALALTPAEGHA